jgi:phosphatidylinositol glycan class B
MVNFVSTQALSTRAVPDRAAAADAVPWWRGHPSALAGLGALLLLAIVLRLMPVIFSPSINWWDEVFQSTEQAHRLIYGYGLVPWEFQLHARSWLLPGAIAGLIELARIVGDGPDYYLPVIAVTRAALAAAPVYCAFQWGRRKFGLTGAFVTATVVAVAPELVYFGGRSLSEVVAAHLLVVGLYLIEPGYPVDSRRRLMAAGALFGLVCLLRVQLAPAVAIMALWPSEAAWRTRLPPLIAGGLIALGFGAALDWVTLGYPFASIWRYVVYNIFYDVSSGFGTEPWNFYLLGEIGLWGAAIAVVIVAVGVGAWRMPALFAGTVAIIAVHSAIAHKEYRFIYPAIALISILAGLGLAQLGAAGERWLRSRGLTNIPAPLIGALIVGYWACIGATVWTGATMTALRHRAHDNLMAAAFVAHMPTICGVGLYGEQGRDWARYGGYTLLHRPVPLFWPEDERELRSQSAGFDVLLFTAAPPSALGFETARCFGKTCIARRPGQCVALPETPMPFPGPLTGIVPPPSDFAAVPAKK